MIIPLGFGQANFMFGGAALTTGAQITLGFEHTGSDLNASEAAEGIWNAWVPTVFTLQVNDITLDSIHVKYGPNDIGQEGDYGSSIPGGDAGDDHSPNVALLVKKVTEVGGHAGKGRLYLPGLGESDVDTGGTIDSSRLGAFQEQFDEFYEALIGLELTPVVLHGPDSPITTPTPISAFQVDARAATQRRRLRR